MVAVNSGAAAVSVEVRVLAGAGDDSYVCTDWTAQPSPAQVVEQPQNSDQDQHPSRAGSFFLGGLAQLPTRAGGAGETSSTLSGGDVSML